MANIVFTDTGKSVRIAFNAKSSEYGALEYDIPKNSTSMRVDEDKIKIYFKVGGEIQEIDYNDVDTPAVTDATDLRDKLDFFFDVAKRIVTLTFPGIFSTTNSGMTQIPEGGLLPEVGDIGGKKIMARLAVDYFLDTDTEGEFDLFNYTDFVPVAGTTIAVDISGNWLYAKSAIVELIGGKTYRVRLRRTVGTGGAKKIYIEGAVLIPSYE